MKDLAYLVQILTPERLKSIRVFNGAFLNNSSATDAFIYKKLRSRKNITNKDIAALLGLDESSNRWHKIRSRFKSRILNTLFFLNVRRLKAPDYQKEYFKCLKNWVLVRILLLIGARPIAIKICLKIYNIAKRNQYFELLFLASKTLQMHYMLKGNEKKCYQYYDTVNHCLRILTAESKAEFLYQQLIIKYTRSIEKTTQQSDVSKKILNSINNLNSNYKTYAIEYYLIKIKTLNYQLKNEPLKAIKLIDHIEAKQNPRIRSRLMDFYLVQMSCCVQTKNFNKGLEIAKKCLKIKNEVGNNWFTFMEMYYVLAMNTANYNTASKILNEVIYDSRFKYQLQQVKERWRILESFNYLVWEFQKSKDNRILKMRKKKFNLAKFMNDVPIYSKDKRGYNVPILIIQIMFFLQRKQFNRIIDRMEAIKVYRSRYMRKDSHYRSNCFIRMLEIMEKGNFDYAKTNRLAHTYYIKLLNNKSDTPLSEFEIIPYERLWIMVLDKLKESENISEDMAVA